MNEKKPIITLKEYLQKNKEFLIPDYQRGYIWGKSRMTNNKQDKDSVTYMLNTIVEGYYDQSAIFIQGVTVCEQTDKIVVIDGQQRTTFFYLLLLYLQYKGAFVIDYQIRKRSNDFLRKLSGLSTGNLVAVCGDNPNEEFQDIYYFKKTIRLIDETITNNKIDSTKLIEYLLEKVQFLYIDIPEEKAVTVFTMMNGSKAKMSDEDVIKSELLRMVSLDIDDSELVKREQDMLRSRYAREWDRWLHWWNQPRVKSFYKLKESAHPLFLLLTTYLYAEIPERIVFNFENFSSLFINTKEKAKRTFYELRHTQKRFEDAFNDVSKDNHLHNTIGGIIDVLGQRYALDFIYDYFSHDAFDCESLQEAYKLSFMGGLTYLEMKDALNKNAMKEGTAEKLNQAKMNLKAAIESDDMYNNGDYKEIAFRQLLHLNIEQDNQLGRAFNFDVWRERSIEHIFPKSKIYKVDNMGNNVSYENSSQIITDTSNYLKFEDMESAGCTQHCIGNFALLYARNNSKFGNKTFDEKKNIFFDTKGDEEVDVFQSRELLHTVFLFAKKDWGISEIVENKDNVIKKLKEYYDEL